MYLRGAEAYSVVAKDGPTWQYFWQQTPYALGAFITFCVGITLFVITLCLFKKYSDREKRYLLASFALVCIGYAFFAAVFAIRAVMQFNSQLLFINNIFTYILVFFAPGAAHMAHYLTEKRYRVIKYCIPFIWLGVILTYISLINGNAFNNRWLFYEFGSYPLPKYGLTYWTLASAIGYVFVLLPVFYHFIKLQDRKINWPLIAAFHLLILTSLSNIPNFIGYGFYPAINFAFLPLLVIAFHIFRDQFKDYLDLLIAKKVLFYFIISIVCVTLFSTFIFVTFGLDRSFYVRPDFWHKSGFLLVSIFFLFSCGILLLVSGRNRFHHVIAGGLLCSWAIYLVGALAGYLELLPVVKRRLGQMSFAMVALLPMINMRLAWRMLSGITKKMLIWVDGFSALFLILAFTPYSFDRYIPYSFADVPQASIVYVLLQVLNLATAILIGMKWIKQFESNKPENYVLMAMLTYAFLQVLHVIPSIGIETYPWGNLALLPAMVLMAGVVRSKLFLLWHHTVRRFMHYVIFALIFLLCFAVFSLAKGGFREMVLQGLPLFLFGLAMAALLTALTDKSATLQKN